MPPIINSHETGKITEKTKEVFIECSGFDFQTLKVCLNIIVTALADMGGEIHSMELFYPKHKEITPDLSPRKISLNVDYANKILGLKLSEDEIKKYLERMGYGYKSKSVLIPCYRADILHPIDIVEDIAIAYGYENFRSEIPNISTIAKENDIEIFKRKIREILIGLGLLETSSYSIVSKEQLKKTKINNATELLNPINKEFNALRPSLLPSLLQILSENQHNEYPQKIFEINMVFGDKENNSLAIAVSHEKANFTEAKQILDALFSSLNINYELEEESNPIFIAGRSGEILIKNKPIGILGEVHPEVLTDFNCQMPVSLIEISLEDLKEK